MPTGLDVVEAAATICVESFAPIGSHRADEINEDALVMSWSDPPRGEVVCVVRARVGPSASVALECFVCNALGV